MQQKLGDVGRIGSTAPLAFFVVDPAFPNTRGDADAVLARGRARRAGGMRRARLAIRLILTGRNTPRAPRATRRSRETRVAHGPGQRSAVVGSITARTSETRFAGKPPCRACSRTISSFGAT